MRKFLNSTTSLTLCMALVAPGLMTTRVAAQTNDVVACGDTEEQNVFPCSLKGGTIIETEEDFQTLLTEGGVDALMATGGTDVKPPEADVSSETPQNEPSLEQGLAEGQADAEEALDEAAAAAAVGVVASEEAASEVLEGDVAEEAAPTDTETASDEPDAAADQTEAPAEQADAEAPIEEAETDTPQQAEADASIDTVDQPVETENEAVTEEVQEALPAPEAPAQDAVANTDADAQTEVPQVDPEAEAARQEERRLEREAELEAARAAMAEEPSGEIMTEEVTTEETRRSDEDFETTATGTPEAEKDSGLSNLEKALLVGLGAAVVGTVLKNGDKVLSNSGDRVVVQDEGGALRVLKDDDALLRRPGDEVRTERFSDGSTRQTVTKPDGGQIVTIRASNGTVLRRTREDADGNQTVLFDDLVVEEKVVVSSLPPVTRKSLIAQDRSEEELRVALIAEQRNTDTRAFSLRQVREINQVRALAPQIELDAARFASGSAAIAPEQARSLSRVGNTMRQLIADDPRTVFLIEGHTDAVGDATYNLALSDRRAETVALAMTEYFDVPPENMVTQGYGESTLKVQTLEAEQANRRAVVRNITNLLKQASN